MCCIFTCFGWMVDLLQRAWTFTMTCVIASAIVGSLMMSSMAGISLGYNYSLAEYIDLKETNVSVYIKRGVFDDEIADDMDWRRSGHLPVAGQLKDENLMTGAPADEPSSLRSGRRLDDSVFDADDHHNYEGSLMKLTAKPLHLEQSTVMTDDAQMVESLTNYPIGSLDQMKAIQGLIDSRRAMATGGSTISSLATYGDATNYLPIFPRQNNPNRAWALTPVPFGLMAPDQRRSGLSPQVNPARYAVPDASLVTDKVAWRFPKYPDYYIHTTLKDGGIVWTSPTYPTAVTVVPMLVRPTASAKNDQPPEGAIVFPPSPRMVGTTQPAPLKQSGQEQSDVDQRPDVFNEKVLMEGDELSKTDNQLMPKMESGGKSAEEEYEDEIKGLPVRRRRSIMAHAQMGEGRNPTEINNKNTKNNGNTVKNIFTSLTTSNEINGNYEDIFTINKNISIVEASNDTKTAIKISHKDNNSQQRDTNEKGILDPENNEDIRINTKISLFESKIIPTKYVSNNLATELEKKQPFNNKRILNSISVRLKDEELVRNQASKFLKVLQSFFNT